VHLASGSPAISDADLARVKELWGDPEGIWRTGKAVHWTQNAAVQKRINRLVSGDAAIDRFQYFIQKYVRRRPVERALTVGCGHGELERGLAKYNLARVHEGIDVSEGAVAEATKLAEGSAIKLLYTVADLNSIALPRFHYDIVFGVMSIHHVAALEHLFQQVADSLKPGGYFFLDEYIGPDQFQWRDAQLDAINDQILLMPDRFKQCVEDRNIVKGEVVRWTIEEMNRADPSEAIRSADILPLLSRFFEVLEVKGYGGAILHPLLEHIAGNFSEGDPEAIYYLQVLFELEDELLQSGKIRHDFAVVIARKKATLGTWFDFLKQKVSTRPGVPR